MINQTNQERERERTIKKICANVTFKKGMYNRHDTV